MSYEYTVQIPAEERATFRLLAKKMGWSISRPKKLSAYEQSKMEARNGQVESFSSPSELFASLSA